MSDGGFVGKLESMFCRPTHAQDLDNITTSGCRQKPHQGSAYVDGVLGLYNKLFYHNLATNCELL
jgi:hypothetical protein